MRPISIDLRQRIVSARNEDGLSMGRIAERFRIPRGTVQNILGAHLSPSIRQALDKAGAELRYLPPYSPDFNPIKLMWSKVKTALRSAKARTQEELGSAVAHALSLVTPAEIQSFFCH